MTDDSAQTALAALDKITAQRERLASRESEAILNALRAGARQVDIARAARRSREHIRQVAKRHGIEEAK